MNFFQTLIWDDYYERGWLFQRSQNSKSLGKIENYVAVYALIFHKFVAGLK